jgi:ABC-type siderophore export system fused ATPase/permease subunit
MIFIVTVVRTSNIMTLNEFNYRSIFLFNLLRDNIDTIKKNTEALIDASKEVGLEVNAEKTKCMLMSHHQTGGQNHDMKVLIGIRSLENVVRFKYWERQ